MKRFLLTIMALFLAIGSGLTLPKVVLTLADNRLSGSSQSAAVEEPNLFKAADEPSRDTKAEDGLSVAQKLACYMNEEPSTVLMSTNTQAENDNAIGIAMTVMESMLDQAPTYQDAWVVNHLAYFSDGTIFAVWNVWLQYEDTWSANFIIDDATGAILSMVIRDKDLSFPSLFVSCWEESQRRDGSSFDLILREHVAAAISNSLGSPESIQTEYLPDAECLFIQMDGQELPLPYYVLPDEGIIAFNPISDQQLAA